MRKIPLRAVPNQSTSVLLGGQRCTIRVYQKRTGLFLDLLVDDAPVALAVLCHDRVRLIRNVYQGFTGDLAFADALGVEEPDYTGLGSRFALVYLEPADL